MFSSPLLVYRVSGGDRKQPPRARNTLELVLAAVLELDPRTCDEVLHGRRDENFAGSGERSYACADRDGDAGDLVVVQLALARVQAGTKLDAEGAHLLGHGLRAADRPRRAVERGEEAVARSVLFLAAKARELAPHERVMTSQQLTPALVAELTDPLGRPDDVREEEGCEHRIGDGRYGPATDELLDFVDDLGGQENAPVVRALEPNLVRTRDSRCDFAVLGGFGGAFAVEHEGRRLNRRQDR